jgi:uncharacterized protein (DUF433 family)
MTRFWASKMEPYGFLEVRNRLNCLWQNQVSWSDQNGQRCCLFHGGRCLSLRWFRGKYTGVNRPVNDRIDIDPEIQHGKPVIRGTRVPVARVLGGLAGGMSFEEICHEYDVTVEDIRAAIQYAGELVEEEAHHPLPA